MLDFEADGFAVVADATGFFAAGRVAGFAAVDAGLVVSGAAERAAGLAGVNAGAIASLRSVLMLALNLSSKLVMTG
ncbi:MAG: hypothetical protein B7X44_01160 [Halothiobacillus sp. 15-55-196]|nr:MAG: hypothetical protein B7X44_01160 [Halothiobacillus sp. 15-55-196]